MPITEIYNQNQIFLDTAKHYISRNWSVIPVWGVSQPAQFKVATLSWTPFTHCHATEDVLYHWFISASHQGIAIITGRISKLAVLDFDSEETYRTFLQKFPHLTNTYTVKTNRGYHFYFEIPDTCTAKSIQGQGIDWQWNGRYVVAPPTQGYSVENTQNPRLLAQSDISSIESFINVLKPFSTHYAPSEKQITKSELQSLYHKQATAGNRNQALFQSGLTARDRGWTLQETIATLAHLHAENSSQTESTSTREREAIATLKSAFSRPPRKTAVRKTAIPNTVREALMQTGLTAVIRVIEGLRQLGLVNGAYFNRQEAIQALKGLVGEHSIVKALTALLEDDSPLFNSIESHQPPLENPHSPKGLATNTCQRHISKCLEIRYSKPHFSQRGRKTHWYQLPSNAELAQKLGLELSVIADELDLEALSSAKATRKALHRAYIARRPGAYPNLWLAGRLGVSIITKNRYDKEIPDLYKRVTYTERAIYWENIGEIPTIEVAGCFLQDERGKRYPAQQSIARHLLTQKRQLRLMKQGVNYYWVGSRFDVSQTQVNTVREVRPPWVEKAAQYRKIAMREAQPLPSPKIAQIEPATKEASSVTTRTIDTPIQVKPTNVLAGHKPYRPFTDTALESIAIQIQERVKRMSNKATAQLSLSSSRRLIIQYGADAVLKSLKQIEKGRDVENPAGLLTVILRSDAKFDELQALTRKSCAV